MIPSNSEILGLLNKLDRVPADALEGIYIGRRFRNDTERLVKLFELYTKMTAKQANMRKPRATGI